MRTQTRASPRGNKVDMMGVDRLLQSMNERGDRAGSRWELPALLYSYNGLSSIDILLIVVVLRPYQQLR